MTPRSFIFKLTTYVSFSIQFSYTDGLQNKEVARFIIPLGISHILRGSRFKATTQFLTFYFPQFKCIKGKLLDYYLKFISKQIKYLTDNINDACYVLHILKCRTIWTNYTWNNTCLKYCTNYYNVKNVLQYCSRIFFRICKIFLF